MYQAVRRCYRFGQKREVVCHIVISEIEGAVLANIKRKESDAGRMATEMVSNMMAMNDIGSTKRQSAGYSNVTQIRMPDWLIGHHP
jgi:hypothetical protein